MTESNKLEIHPGLSVRDLHSQFDGRVIVPGDDGYDQARTSIYAGVDRRPAAFIRPANADQVAQVIALAHQSGLELAVRSGGHSLAVHSLSNGGIVLDLAEMTGLEIDPGQRTAWAQSGLTAGKYLAQTAKHGLATGFGDTATVGLGGLTLGGGVGYLVRKYGLTIDQLLAAEVVTADGQQIYTDSQSHPDLFWALRGGGGNFGIVTRFKYQLHPVDQVFGGMLILPATADVIAGLVAEAEAAPEELSIIANIMKAPPMPFLPPEAHGKLIAMITLVYAGTAEEGQKAVAGIRKLATPIADMLRPLPYLEMFPAEEGDFRPIIASLPVYVDQLDRTAAALILDQLQASTAMMPVCQLRVLGGAVARVPDDATAYAHRQRRMLANFAGVHMNPAETPVHQEWANQSAGLLTAGKDSGMYANFLGNVDAASVRRAYPGSTFDRLARVKAHYDPDNFFHLNQNIPPA